MCPPTNHVLCTRQCNSRIEVFHRAPIIPPELGGQEEMEVLAYPVAISVNYYTFGVVMNPSSTHCTCKRINVHRAPRKEWIRRALVCVLECQCVLQCSFQCPKLCADCMPYIKTKESPGSFAFCCFLSFFFYIHIDLWSTQWNVNSLNYILLWSKSCCLFLKRSSRGLKSWHCTHGDNGRVEYRTCGALIGHKGEKWAPDEAGDQALKPTEASVLTAGFVSRWRRSSGRNIYFLRDSTTRLLKKMFVSKEGFITLKRCCYFYKMVLIRLVKGAPCNIFTGCKQKALSMQEMVVCRLLDVTCLHLYLLAAKQAYI